MREREKDPKKSQKEEESRSRFHHLVRNAVAIHLPVRLPVGLRRVGRLGRRSSGGLTLKEGHEDSVWVLERVVDDVDEVELVHNLGDEAVGFRSVLVELGPLTTDREGFVLPSHERDGLDDGGLDDLLAG
jgi:hypothetical protein